MPWKFFYILNNDGLRFFPTGATNASPFFDPRTGNGSLKRRQHQLTFFHQVKPNPQPAELFHQRSYDISKVGNQIGLTFNYGNKPKAGDIFTAQFLPAKEQRLVK